MCRCFGTESLFPDKKSCPFHFGATRKATKSNDFWFIKNWLGADKTRSKVPLPGRYLAASGEWTDPKIKRRTQRAGTIFRFYLSTNGAAINPNDLQSDRLKGFPCRQDMWLHKRPNEWSQETVCFLINGNYKRGKIKWTIMMGKEKTTTCLEWMTRLRSRWASGDRWLRAVHSGNPSGLISAAQLPWQVCSTYPVIHTPTN